MSRYASSTQPMCRGSLARHEHVVRDHRLRAHVAEVGLREVRAVGAQPLKFCMWNWSAYSGRIWSKSTISTRVGFSAWRPSEARSAAPPAADPAPRRPVTSVAARDATRACLNLRTAPPSYEKSLERQSAARREMSSPPSRARAGGGGASLLRGGASCPGAARGPRASRRRRTAPALDAEARSDRIRQPFERELAVSPLAPLVLGDRTHKGAPALRETALLGLRERCRAPNVEARLDARLGLLRVLAARPARPRRPKLDLGERNREPLRDPEGVDAARLDGRFGSAQPTSGTPPARP